MKNFYLLPFYFLLLTLSGCATVPARESLPAYNINGVTYLPLISLCELKGIKWDYDTFTRVVTLSRDAHKINLMVGQRQALIDGRPEHLKHPPAFYEGALAVPYKFKEEIIDVLFGGPARLPAAVLSSSPIKKIIIDAGHGGNDPGAIGVTGLREKAVTLDIAKRLSNLLKAEGLDIIMTRSNDTFIPLARRVQITNASGADLFISIHANANHARSLNGFETYYISPGIDTDSRRAAQAADEAHLDLDSAYFTGQSADLKAILWDMIYTSNRKDSFELASSLCRVANSDLNIRTLGVKSANFYVLKGARVPAVLIEVGFLSNKEEERKLRNGYYRQQLAEAIKHGLEDYARELLLAKGNLNE